MNITRKLSLIVAATTVSVFGIASHAFAGEGAAAGSAAFSIDGGAVTGVAVSAAIGKQDAFAGAFNDFDSNNAAFAQGSAGTISVSSLEPTSIGSLSSTADTQLGVDQGNSFDATTSVQIGTQSPNSVVNVQP